MEPPEEFPFPFEPYDIQKGFMTKLYQTLEEGKVGIFESPTGTGKSLSLICGALKWLQDHEDRQKREVEEILEGAVKSSSPEQNNKDSKEPNIPAAPDWVQQFAKKREAEERTLKSREEQEAKVKREARLEEIRKTNRAKFFSNKRKRKEGEKSEEDEEEFTMMKDETSPDGPAEKEEDEELIVDDYKSDEEDGSKQTRSEDDKEEEVHITKIYYCSRTHSQLAQFVREVQKSPFGKDVRVVSLGSRQNLCINDSVRKLGSTNLINDRCLEMQNKKKKEESRGKGDDADRQQKRRRSQAGGCPFHQHIPTYSDEVLAEVRDIEQLVVKGRKMDACPYYGTRYSIPAAQLVALPYNTLLHKHTREVTGIKLEGNVVIIDEAHNLVDTITGIHSVDITGGQIARAYSQLTQYAQRYKSRLLAKNLRYIKQILHVLKHFIMCLGGKAGQSPEEPSAGIPKVHLRTINDFLFTAGMDNINLFKIQRYCEKSHISRKLNGFVEKYQPSVIVHTAKDTKADTGGGASSVSKFLQQIKQGNMQQTGGTQQSDTPPPSSAGLQEETPYQSSSPFMHIEAFLLALTNADKDGRVVINKQARLSQSSLRFLLLNPALHFMDIVRQARAVIMAGGTMQPVSEFKEHLLFAAGVKPQRITEFSCGHVIPACNLLPVALGSGPAGGAVEFSYEHRNKEHTMVELGRVLVNLCNLVPAGVCIFFPSYEYERQVYKFFEDSGVLKRLAVRKQVFREPKKASQVDQVLSDYSKCIQRCKTLGHKAMPLTGALLFSVVGGKMSEGINFSDDLGRCVVMVGLPYPNIKSPELKEKMDYLDATLPHHSGKSPGQIHYENLCMKAVNQSIGRAIRHKDDYATILLLDRRYFRPNICAALPDWISSHLQTISKFGDAFGTIRKFFMAKKADR
ncbi:ATP-dependent DNA helicase DDX11-like isoform X1 [Branchiostoma lanceolatum]|uniref:ATP-dependent DNA helicase DDX11-like isoform X1 n=1 Tax=Branchiostoma lanceolatum TaxID=7740 RepID=UPI0034523098